MAQYVDKDIILDEIIRRRDKIITKKATDNIDRIIYGHELYSLMDLFSFIDDMEAKEVDLEKVFNDEYSKFSNDPDAMDYAFPIDLADYKDFAKHFFELGIKAKGEYQ